MESLTLAAETKPTDLVSLTAEIKIYVQQWGQNTIEIGKRLIAAKKLVAQGEWQNWLEQNFNLKYRSAKNFMDIAERFGSKLQTIADLNYSQMIQLLALPEGEEENFIAEKAAEGTPVEDMTVRELQAEVTKYKAEIEQEKAKTENLFSEVEQAQAEKTALEDDKKRLNEERDKMQKQLVEVAEKSATLQSENAELQEQLKNQKPIEKIVAPKDYEPLKKQLADKQLEVAELEKKLKEKPIEVKNTAELEKAQKDLADLQAKYDEMTQFAVLIQKFDSISEILRQCIYSPVFNKALKYYKQKNESSYSKMATWLEEFFNFVKE